MQIILAYELVILDLCSILFVNLIERSFCNTNYHQGEKYVFPIT